MYYRDYDGLAIHFQETHYRCMEPQCVERLFIVFETEGALEYHMEKEHRLGAKVKSGKTRFDASNLLGLQLENPAEDEMGEEELEALQNMGMDIDQMEEAAQMMQRQGLEVPDMILNLLAKVKAKKNAGQPKKNQIMLRDNQGIDMTRIFKKADGDQVDLIPETPDPEDEEVDLRYFLIAVGNRGVAKVLDLSKVSADKKVTYIDDLEIPSKKGQNLEQLYIALNKNFSYMTLEAIKQAFIAFRMGNISAFTLLQEFESQLGIAKAFKYYWAFANNSKTSGDSEMLKALKKSLNKMTFRDTGCILAKCSSYYDILYGVSTTLYQYLVSNQDRLQPITEVRLNTLISSVHGMSIGHLLQARPLPHLVSSAAVGVLRQLLFATGDGQSAAMQAIEVDDLLVLLVYFLVALIKCADPTSASSPGWRGLEWIRDKQIEFDLSWIPLEKKDRVPKAGAESIYGTSAEEFPELVPKKPTQGEINIQEMLARQAENKKQFEISHGSSQGVGANQFMMSNGVRMPISMQQPSFMSMFGPNFKIPLMDPTKPAPLTLHVNTLPVIPIQGQPQLLPMTFEHKPSVKHESTLHTSSIESQNIDNGITIFKKQRKKK